ncbi:winged helix-turn-helix domain-containing protein [Streptomyces sp. MRC013]|uniref:winged helix-turn-helix transcriptional regulator n=1 Tax=Streptomyces sp. MRC013 TaxID=2898276 RepID=UPI002026DD06|nr:winged helix-turn-helix domain-containing protein [Streptomyces sp. MRC013]URM90400.1 winged helix-turn-helix domain-containing protein [Streptomyces sp. MRC013]
MAKTTAPRRRVPPILIGASLLAALSLIWSAYAITDLMNAGRFGLSVAVAGDIAWLTVLWAEYRGVTITIGKTTIRPAEAGWAIAAGVAILLALHGYDARSWGQGVAGPFVVLVGKLVWAYALASLRDPAALTAEQEAEIHAVMRDSEFTARLNAAERDRIDREADAEIARIRAEARITLARDETDFEITLERLEKRARIERNSPLALTVSPRAQLTEPAEPPAHRPAEPVAHLAEPEPVHRLSSQVTTPEPPAQPAQPFGFSAQTNPQSAQRAASVERVAELLAQDPGLTSGQVAEALSVSPATAKRYLREARRGGI